MLFCHKLGHFKHDCFKYKKWKSNKDKTEKTNAAKGENERTGSVCFNVDEAESHQDTWYVDLGATSHMTYNQRFFDVLERKNMRDVTLANGQGAKVLGIGSGQLKCFNENNKEIKVKIKDLLCARLNGEFTISEKAHRNGSYSTVQGSGMYNC